MLIDIDGRVISIPPHIEAKIMLQLYAILAEKHSQLDTPTRLLLKPLFRHQLKKLEQELNKLGKDGKAVRPREGEDPALRYAQLMFATAQEVMKDAILLIDAEGAGDSVTAFALSIPNPGQGGGQISLSGNVGIGQDVGDESTGQGAHLALPNKSPLHPG